MLDIMETLRCLLFQSILDHKILLHSKSFFTVLSGARVRSVIKME